jgi:hypothetical protein
VIAVVALLPSVVTGGMDPSNFGLPSVAGAVYGLAGPIAANGASAMCVECHTAVPVVARSSHFVHQYTGGTTRNTNNQAATERVDIWSDSGGRSKYGNFTLPVTSVTAVNGEMICESCHNVITNVPGGNNLIEKSFLNDTRPVTPNTLTSATTTLCEGCHTTASLPGHHPMTGDRTNSGVVLSNTDASSTFTRLFVDNVTPVGGATSEVLYPGANRLPCLSCHGNGHTGFTGTGARFLRRGYAGAASTSPASPGTGVVGVGVDGGQRQFDFDSSGNTRMIPNWQPLCDACHTVDV